jgi:predicted small secreted protein
MTMTATEAPAKGQAKGGKAAPVVQQRPFVTGTRTLETEVYSQTVTQTAATQVLTPYEFQVDGYVSGALIRVTATTAGNGAATAFVADGPFSILQSVILEDIGGKQILGPLSGWQLYVLNRFGGFVFQADAKANGVYTVTTGAGATGGSYRFVLRVPIQVRRRDAMGSLPNRNASATFKLKMTINTSASVYSVAPTNAASVNVQVQQHGWATSDNRDYKGNAVSATPNGVGSLLYTDVETIQLSAGGFNQRMATFGGLLRVLIFELRDNAGSRAQGETDWPSLFEIEVDKVKMYSRSPVTWETFMSEDWGLNATAESVTATNTKPDGIYVLHWLDDFGLAPGAENGFRYQPITPSTAVQLIGTIGGAGAHTLSITKNYLSPVNDDPRQLTGGR